MNERLFPSAIPKESTERRYGATVRFAGAQIPVTRDVHTNVEEIKEAIIDNEASTMVITYDEGVYTKKTALIDAGTWTKVVCTFTDSSDHLV